MSQYLRIERSQPALRTEDLGIFPVAAVLMVGGLALALAVTFALVLAGVLPAPDAVVPLFTT
jgi:hypothetical protein